MTQPATLQPVGTTCACVTEHRPVSLVFERHHIWPKEYGGPTVDENLVYVCATTHNNVHAYLRAFVAAGRLLNQDELRASLATWHYDAHVQRYAYDLAVQGWTWWKAGLVG